MSFSKDNLRVLGRNAPRSACWAKVPSSCSVPAQVGHLSRSHMCQDLTTTTRSRLRRARHQRRRAHGDDAAHGHGELRIAPAEPRLVAVLRELSSAATQDFAPGLVYAQSVIPTSGQMRGIHEYFPERMTQGLESHRCSPGANATNFTHVQPQASHLSLIPGWPVQNRLQKCRTRLTGRPPSESSHCSSSEAFSRSHPRDSRWKQKKTSLVCGVVVANPTPFIHFCMD